MDCKGMIFMAAKEGDLWKLKEYVNSRKQEDVVKLVHSRTNGATPLVMAAKNGHTEVVKYLVEECSAGVEYAGSVNFDGETIDGAPPLWCAAAAGHLDIVKYLIQKSANVNSTTLTNSTPLRAACFDGHFDVVRYLVENDADIEIANRHGHTCLMISCYKGHLEIVKYLLSKNADVNRKSIKGNTALHDCAESGSLQIMKLLLDNNAVMDKDAYGMTPLFAAAVTGHTALVEYLIEGEKVPLLEKIEAMELLGATFVDKKRDMMGALRYWKRALTERTRNPVNPIPKPRATSLVAAYEGAKEVQTQEELDELISDPDDMRMQALLVRERILGPAHPDTSYYIRYRGAVYADMGYFERCIALWMYALDMQMDKLDPLSPMTQSSLLSFAELFSFMMGGRNRSSNLVRFQDICAIFAKALAELERGHRVVMNAERPFNERDLNNYSRIITIILHLMSLICSLKSRMTSEQQFQFKKLVYQLVKLGPRRQDGQTLLHLAANSATTNVGKYPVCEFPCVNCIELLTEIGVDMDSVDLQGNTALHTACLSEEVNHTIILSLLKAGMHVDTRNCENKCALDLQSSRRKSLISQVMPHNFVSLKCLAARVVRQHRVKYRDIPHELKLFTNKH